MAVANISAGADEYEYGPDGKKSPFLADTFWEDYKNYDIPQFGTVRVHLDETEQADIDYQERQRKHRQRIKETKVKSKSSTLQYYFSRQRVQPSSQERATQLNREAAHQD